MIKAASLDIHIDLAGFSQFLTSQGLNHRINEESGYQVIWVQTEAEAEFVRQTLASWAEGVQKRASQQSALGSSGSVSARGVLLQLLGAFIASPLTMMLILGCLIVALVSGLGANAQAVDFLFYPRLNSDSFLNLLAGINSPVTVIQTLTPMFLHFGELHLIFNMLWLWYFGKQLEAIQPWWVFALLVVITSFASNTMQYMTTDFNNFGGMSGVVYGLVGYTWFIHTFMPRSYLLLNSNMFVFFVIALLMMEVFASSYIATAAHVGGLITGLLLGVCMVLYYRLILRRQVIGRNRSA